jgi:hypothetical protein
MILNYTLKQLMSLKYLKYILSNRTPGLFFLFLWQNTTQQGRSTQGAFPVYFDYPVDWFRFHGLSFCTHCAFKTILRFIVFDVRAGNFGVGQ